MPVRPGIWLSMDTSEYSVARIFSRASRPSLASSAESPSRAQRPASMRRVARLSSTTRTSTAPVAATNASGSSARSGAAGDNSQRTGSVTVAATPRPTPADSSRSVPPWPVSTIARASGSPRPVPSRAPPTRVVWKGIMTFRSCSGARPRPVSRTTIASSPRPAPRSANAASSVTEPRSVNLRALDTRFVTACFRTTPSARTASAAGTRAAVRKATGVPRAFASPKRATSRSKSSTRTSVLAVGNSPESHLARSRMELRIDVTVWLAEMITPMSSAKAGASARSRSRTSICGKSWLRISWDRYAQAISNWREVASAASRDARSSRSWTSAVTSWKMMRKWPFGSRRVSLSMRSTKGEPSLWRNLSSDSVRMSPATMVCSMEQALARSASSQR
mmetsp:Transcript_24517/g.73585  ORF Transcript_24517/g.73585 Transcript_24517/m.73585 type:complete len:392 (-) Transcript_24517:556-1731(-)